MSTRLRDFAPGLQHLWIGATGNETYFRDEIDRMNWIRGLIRTTALQGWTCVAFCQMTTHVHLIVDVPDRSLPTGMQRLNSDYGRRFNDRHDRVGLLIRRRYGSRRIESAADLLGVFAYVVLNPVRAGFCPRAEVWHWSSAATTLAVAADFPFVDASLVLAEFNGSTERLRSFIEARRRAYLAEQARSRRLTTGRGPWGHA